MKVLKAKDCSAVVELVLNCDDASCLANFDELKVGTVDAAQEKHVPVIVREGNKVTVKVGSVAHPMEDKHYITFVAVVQGNKTQRVDLHPGEAPEAVFMVEDGPLTAYEYCNLHGLWSAEV